MLDIITEAYENDHRQIDYSDDSRPLGQHQSGRQLSAATPRKQRAPLPWRWTVLIITTLSTLLWIGILFAVIAVLNSL